MKKLVVLLSIAWVAAGIGAVYLWLQLADLRNQKTAVLARVETLEARAPLAAASAPPPQSAGITVAPETTHAAAPASATAVPAAEPSAMTRTMARVMTERMLPDLNKELNLAPDEFDKLMNLLADQRGKGKASEEAVAAMLGSRYPQWQEYQKTLPARLQISQLRGQLAATGSALPESQVKPLMTALNAELQRVDEEHPLTRAASVQEAQEQVWQFETAQSRRLVEAAKPYLNAQQLDSYRKMLDQQLEFARTTLKSLDAGALAAPRN